MVRTMMVASALLLGSASAFIAPAGVRLAAPKVKASMRMSVSDEPWFADAVATTVVDKETLE
jgi:hypothetical protein